LPGTSLGSYRCEFASSTAIIEPTVERTATTVQQRAFHRASKVPGFAIATALVWARGVEEPMSAFVS
jgi:hypothetical protein